VYNDIERITAHGVSMAGVTEENRRRLAIALSLLGVVLVLGGVALTIQHQQSIARTQGEAGSIPPEQRVRLAQAIQQILFVLLVLVGVFAIGTLAFLRWSRRFRSQLFRRPRPPTPAEDVWAMHRLPEELAEEGPTEEEPPEPEHS
jgi:ABC-type Fe3+ transport system permease subunit